MKILFKYLIHTLRFILGGIFIYSAYTKIISIDTFELFIFRHEFFSWALVVIIARIIIFIELAIGISLLFNLFTKQILRFTIVLLFVFSIYLLYIIITGENISNCNCFGTSIELSPYESLLKNIVSIILCIILFFKSIPWNTKYKRLIFYSVLFLSLLTPFIISPPDLYFLDKYSYKNEKNSKFNTLLLGDFKYNNKKYNIEQGKKLICFFSMHCKICKLSAQKISIIHKKLNSNFPVFYVFFGEEKDIDTFFKNSKSIKFPYKIVPIKDFFQLSDKQLPIIYFLEDGVIKNKVGYRNIFRKDIEEFFSK
jgi:hypothetical protein